MAKRYEELDFSDNFMFCKIMETHKDLCKELIEIILDIKVKDINYIQAEKEEKESPDSRGVRLDVYVDDDKGTVYDLEMQTTRRPDIAKRTRYYHGAIDLMLLKSGDKMFEDLNKTYVVFICMFDPFGLGLARYTFEKLCVEEPKLRLRDDAYTVFINPYSQDLEMSEEMRDFFDFLLKNEPKKDFTRKLRDAIIDARQTKEWRSNYMRGSLFYQDAFIEGRNEGRNEGREEGREEGRNEGVVEGRFEILKKALDQGMDENIILSLGFTKEDIEKVTEKVNN